MPVVGVVCGRDGACRSFDECIKRHESGIQSCQAPVQLLRMLQRNPIERKDAGMSATTLLQCPRSVAIQAAFPWYENLVSGWNKSRGSMIHHMMEADVRDHLIKERRAEATVTEHGITFKITGQMDEVDPERGVLIDYKHSDVIPEKPRDDHEAQFNIYVWLLARGSWQDTKEPCNILITSGGMHYVANREKKKRNGTIILPWKKIGYPVWDFERTEGFILDRLRPLFAWKESGKLPDCNPFKRWGKHWRCDCEKLEEQIRKNGDWPTEE